MNMTPNQAANLLGTAAYYVKEANEIMLMVQGAAPFDSTIRKLLLEDRDKLRKAVNFFYLIGHLNQHGWGVKQEEKSNVTTGVNRIDSGQAVAD